MKHDILFKTSEEGDWVECWINGEQIMRGHSFDDRHLEAVLNALGVQYEMREKEFTLEEWETGEADKYN